MKKPVKGKPVPKAKTQPARKPAPPPRPVRYGGSGGPAGGAGGAAGPVRGGAGVPVRGGSGGPAKRAKPAAKAKHHPRRKLTLGEGVACCSAEALAASLRLLGAPVSDEDVLALYWRTATDMDAGASILATLEAASRFGLAGVRPTVRQHQLDVNLGGAWPVQVAHLDKPAALEGGGRFGWRDEPYAVPHLADHGAQLAIEPVGDGLDLFGAEVHALILGVDLPGPHAVLATAAGWWSWGELYDPACWPDAVIEEAWTIEWEVG